MPRGSHKPTRHLRRLLAAGAASATLLLLLLCGAGIMLRAGLPDPLTAYIPHSLLAVSERARDALASVLIEDDWRDCSDTELFLKPSPGARLTIPEPEQITTPITIAAVGDVLLHTPLQRQGFAQKDGFRTLWADVEPILKNADLTYANLEGPVAPLIARGRKLVKEAPDEFDGKVFTSYPLFNYPERLLFDLKSSGVDVVSTANNHSLDRGWQGADSTVNHLVAHGLQYTGTRLSTMPDAGWHTVTKTKGKRIAWLACTYGTNGIPDRKSQVLHCFQDEAALLKLIAKLSARKDVDALIVTPHWGQQYKTKPTQQQTTLARTMIEAGATAVLGSHPHVIQPWEVHETKAGRKGLILYSLGNFVSGQSGIAKRSTIILLMGLGEDANGKLILTGARYVPLAMTYRSRKSELIGVEATDRYRPRHKLARRAVTRVLSDEHILPPNGSLRPYGTCTPPPLKS